MPRNKFRAPLALVALFMTPAMAQAGEDAAAAALLEALEAVAHGLLCTSGEEYTK